MLPSRGQKRTRLGVAIVATVILSVVSAQSTRTSSSASKPSSTASSGPKVFTVAVGANGAHSFDPDVVSADVGDIVSFNFYPTNHSVVRGEWTGSKACGPSGCNPCVPYEVIHPDMKDKGFHSKNVLTDKFDQNAEGNVYNVTIKDKDPIWYYCTARDSCTPNGMVGVINPGNGTSIEKQIIAAQNAKFQLEPGQSWPVEGGKIPGAENNTTSPSSSPAPVTHDHRLSAGAIAGIAVGGAVVVLLAAGLCYFVGRSNTYKEVIKARESEGEPSHAGDPLANWSPPNQAATVTPQMQQQGWGLDHRFSGQTAYSQMSPRMDMGSTFVGYNRQTGAPEFAQKVPAGAVPVDEKKKPPTGHPAFGAQSQQDTTYELPGEQLRTAELGDSNPQRHK